MISDDKTDVELKGVCELVLKGLKSGEIKGPKIEPDTGGAGDGMDVPVPKNIKELVTKLKELKILKDADGDNDANMQAQFDLMNKRIAAVEVLASQCQSSYAKLEGMIQEIQDDIENIQAAQESATLGPQGTDVNEDPVNTTASPGKGYHHYSEALFGNAGSEKTKQQPKESSPTVLNRLKCLIKH